MKKKLKLPLFSLGETLWASQGDVSYEVKVVFINHGIYFCAPTVDSVTEGHYAGCVSMKIHPGFTQYI